MRLERRRVETTLLPVFHTYGSSLTASRQAVEVNKGSRKCYMKKRSEKGRHLGGGDGIVRSISDSTGVLQSSSQNWRH